MPLSVGERLGPYEILAQIGAGGMGEVYRAHDARLGRDVAIKVSASQFTERFEREAKLIASLNHPNICSLFDVGPNFLVMELVEGPTLAERIAEGALPLEEAIRVAAQIAAALEAAHEKGIVHRDLKPANVKIRPNGAVKVLDFGLAKPPAPQTASSRSPADSPTLSLSMTEAGVILGTAGYMSPEQARGEPVDKRADVWAFGVVLWEMLTGKRLFHGKTVPDILAAVIRDQPDIGKAPAKVRPLLRRCLEKDPQRRLRHIGDAIGIIEDAPEEAARTTRHWTPWAAAVALLIPLGAVSFVHFREQPSPQPSTVRFQIPAPNDKAPLSPEIAVSPDGRKLAFLYQDKLWVHFFDTGESRGLTATTGGTPFWSPDSRFIGFTADGKVKKIEATGGPAQTVCDLGVNWGSGSWNQDDVILFGQVPGPIFRVPAAGGIPVPVTKVDASRQERTHIEPWFLPDGRHFLYVRRGAQIGYTSYIGSLDAKPEDQSTKPLLTGDGQVVYAPSADPRTGYLLFTREGTLMAQPFDNEKRELTGQPVALAEQVFNAGGWDAFSVSANGVLVFQHDGSARNSQLTWFDRQGKPMGTVGDPARYSDVGLSPDGTQAATVREGANNEDIWLLELARGTSIRFTSDPVLKDNPVWSPDGSRIVFRQRGSGLVLKPSNGAGAQEVLLKSVIDVYPTSWSHDGRFLLYNLTDPKTRSDIWVLPMDGDRKPAVLLNTEFNEGSAAFSPDGRWISYNSDESGKPEVYVRPFEPPSGKAPAVGAQRVISTGGGRGSAWRADGKELYYGSLDGKPMAVEIATSPVFRAGTPHVGAFSYPKGAVAGDRTTDGKRFLIAIQVGENSPQPYSVVLNWPSLLKKN